MRIIIFGTGGVGEDCRVLLERQGHEVIGWVDNNRAKWHTVKDGMPVYPPDEVPSLNADRVAIGIFKAAPAVRRQLHELGIADERIIVPMEPARVFRNERYADDSGIPAPEAETGTPATLAFLRHRTELDDAPFLEKLRDLRQSLKEFRIPPAEVCVVSGAVLQAYGLRASKLFDDIDIVMAERFRELYGRGLVIVSESAEMHPQNEFDVDDQALITDPKWHFVWQGLKFQRLSMLYRRRMDTDEGRLMAPIVNGADKFV